MATTKTSWKISTDKIYSSPQHYANGLSVYRNKSTEPQANIKSIETTLPALLKRIWPGAFWPVPSQIPSVFKVLSVGCGDGAGGDFSICDAIKETLAGSSQKPTIFYQAVDPRADSLLIFRASADPWANKNCAEVELCFRWFTGTWQEYQTETKQDPQKFHLIHFIQSICYLDIEETMRDCVTNRLAAGGIIFCIVSDSDDSLSRFYQAMDVFYPSTETVQSIANKNGWRFDCFNFPYQIDLTEIDDESSVEGNLLLDFFTVTKNYRAVTDKSEVQQVVQFWLDESQVGSDGKRRANGQISAVIIYKS